MHHDHVDTILARPTSGTALTPSDLAIDHRSPIPLYHQIAEKIRAGVEAGKFPIGSSLGSEKRLADELRVSLPTVRRALEMLASEGIVTRKPGVGTFLSDPTPLCLIQAVTVDPSPRGLRCRMTSMERVIPMPPIKKRLALNGEAGLWRLIRINVLGDKRTAVLENYFVNEPTTADRLRLERSEINKALMSTIRKGNTVHHEIKALAAEGWLVQELQTTPGTPLIILEQTVHAGDGKPLEFARHSYLADHHRFEATLSL